MNNNLYQTHNATVVNFPAFSGGKFLMNCLSLSRYACPQDPDIAEHLLTNPADYDYRLRSILTTLPAKSRMKYWRSFEFGDQQLYGDAFKKWSSGNATLNINCITRRLCNSNLKFFITDHSMNPVNLLTVWPCATVIKLINSERFQHVASLLKTTKMFLPTDLTGNYCRQKFESLKGPSWPSWEEFELAGHDTTKCLDVRVEIRQEIEQFYPLQITKKQVLFNVDDCIFDTDKFLTSVQQLYMQMGFDDFNSALIEDYYQQYISLHNTTN